MYESGEAIRVSVKKGDVRSLRERTNIVVTKEKMV